MHPFHLQDLSLIQENPVDEFLFLKGQLKPDDFTNGLGNTVLLSGIAFGRVSAMLSVSYSIAL